MSRKWGSPPICDIRRVISPAVGLSTEVWHWDGTAGGWSHGGITHSFTHSFRKHLLGTLYRVCTFQDVGESNVDVQGIPSLQKTCQHIQCGESKSKGSHTLTTTPPNTLCNSEETIQIEPQQPLQGKGRQREKERRCLWEHRHLNF